MTRPFSVGTMARKVTHVLGRTLRQVDFIVPAYARQGPAPRMRQNRVNGRSTTVIRTSPPMNISRTDVDEAIHIMDEAFTAIAPALAGSARVK